MFDSLKKYANLFYAYIAFISLAGTLPAIIGALTYQSYEPKINFILLLVLGVIAQNAATSVSVGNKSGVVYAVGTAISMGAVPAFGPFAAALIEVVAAISMWAAKPAESTWKRSWKQLGFNAGMAGFSTFIAGWLFLLLRNFIGEGTILGETLPWLVAAIINEQLNLWILIGVLYQQQIDSFSIMGFWRENVWATQVAIFAVSIGGGMLAFAESQFDWVGIVIFFLPIILSAYAFRLYVSQMKDHMDNLEHIVAERTQEMATLMEEKDHFLAILTHDMKSPLTTIGIYAGIIKKHPDVLKKKPRIADSILQSQETLIEMVNNILDLEKLQAGDQMQLEKETLDLATLLDLRSSLLLPQAAAKEIELDVLTNPSPLLMELDKYQFGRVIQNLISNAIKYTPNNGKVSVIAEVFNNQVKVSVQDNGYGIPEEDITSVFDRYSRVSKHKTKAAGTGLGLAITKAIVEAHNGEITVISQEGKGSTFSITLPL